MLAGAESTAFSKLLPNCLQALRTNQRPHLAAVFYCSVLDALR